DPGAERAERDRAPDPEAALPDLEGVHPVTALAEVQLVVRDHVVEPAAHEAERDGPDSDVGHRPGPPAPGDPALVAEPDGNEDADDDAERVAAQRDGAEVQHPARRAGNVGKFHGRVDATLPDRPRAGWPGYVSITGAARRAPPAGPRAAVIPGWPPGPAASAWPGSSTGPGRCSCRRAGRSGSPRSRPFGRPRWTSRPSCCAWRPRRSCGTRACPAPPPCRPARSACRRRRRRRRSPAAGWRTARRGTR